MATISLDQQVSLRTAYLTMWIFAGRYWKRGLKHDSMTDFIVDIGPVLDGQTSDPAAIDDWRNAAEFVLSHPETSWADFAQRHPD